jgi:hypothetical protein
MWVAMDRALRDAGGPAGLGHGHPRYGGEQPRRVVGNPEHLAVLDEGPVGDVRDGGIVSVGRTRLPRLRETDGNEGRQLGEDISGYRCSRLGAGLDDRRPDGELVGVSQDVIVAERKDLLDPATTLRTKQPSVPT